MTDGADFISRAAAEKLPSLATRMNAEILCKVSIIPSPSAAVALAPCGRQFPNADIRASGLVVMPRPLSAVLTSGSRPLISRSRKQITRLRLFMRDAAAGSIT